MLRDMDSTCWFGSRAYVILLIYVYIVEDVIAQNGETCGDLSTEYVVAFPQNTEYSDGTVSLVTATPYSLSTVSLSSPRNSDRDRISTSIVLDSNVARTFTAASSYRIRGSSTSDKAIRVSAPFAFSLFAYSSETNSCDGYLSVPVSSLGTNYMTSCYWPPTLGSQITIAAIEDDTEVSLLFQLGRGVRIDFNGRFYEGGDTLRYTLNAYQVLQVQHTSDLSGTWVKSSRPAAVFSGNAGAYVQAFRRDQSFSALVEQMPPIETWGTEAYVVPFPDKPDTIFKIVASADDTRAQYYFEADRLEWVSQYAGDYEEVQFSASRKFVFVQANKPILITQIASSAALQGEGGSQTSAMTLIPTNTQHKNRYYFTVPTISSNNYLLIACELTSAGRLVLDNVELNLAAFKVFPSTTWGGLSMAIRPGVHVLLHTNPSVRFSAVLYGSSEVNQCTYAHPVGMCHDGPEFPNIILSNLPGFVEDTTDVTMTTGDTTLVQSSTDFYGFGTTDVSDCACSTIFLTGAAFLRDMIGFYYIHTCSVNYRPVYKRQNSTVHVYYDTTENAWVVSRGLQTGDIILRQQYRFIITGDLFDKNSFWEMRIGNQWVSESSINVDCICDQTACQELRIVSRNVDHSFPGLFVLGVKADNRALYVNFDAGVMLTFTSVQSCNYWAVKPLTGSGALMYVYDISPYPHYIRATWQVAKITGWEDDPTISVQCMDKDFLIAP